ncbi:mitochondrial import receptor subunit Tom22 [Blastocladiella emersonii ATCC 22665]|nr:mitochondrial import receptor subunit Tom22 [Blastocladiella emersonii ATCC 22665]
MVRLTDIHDDGHASDADYVSTDYESDAESEYSVTDESLLDRVAALRDIVPPELRYAVADKAAALAGFGKATAFFLGRAAWVLSTTAIVMVAPLVFEMEKDNHMELLEREQMMREQSSKQLMGGAPGVGPMVGAPGVVGAPAGGAPTAIVPPGF